ncbi:MAG: molybdopterin molybdotransferase MoeA [Brevinema sp.]
MINVKDVLPILYEHLLDCSYKILPINEISGKLLYNNIFSPISHPPFNKAAMDGWAYHTDTLQDNISLKLHQTTIKAGDIFIGSIAHDECVRIMTGAKVPNNCNAVHRLEYGTQSKEHVHFNQPETSRNIIFQGQNLEEGAMLLPIKILDSKDIAVLSASGIKDLQIAMSPKIGIVSTGNEIKYPSESCEDGYIYDSNGSYLTNICHTLGFDVTFLGIIPDTEEALADFLENNITLYDIIIFSGAVSQGDVDLIPIALQKINVVSYIHGVTLKPGKPFYFGTLDMEEKKCFFGLPGNPISVFVCFELFVKPYIYKCMGYEYQPKIFQIPLDSELIRKDSEREEYIPAKLVQGDHGINVCPLPYKGSSMVTVLPYTEVLICIEEGTKKLNKGDLVDVRFLQ